MSNETEIKRKMPQNEDKMSEIKQPKFKFGQNVMTKNLVGAIFEIRHEVKSNTYVYTVSNGLYESKYLEKYLKEYSEPLRKELTIEWARGIQRPSMGPDWDIVVMNNVPFAEMAPFIGKRTKVTIEEIV